MSLQVLHNIRKVMLIRKLAGNWKKKNTTVILKKRKREELGNCRLLSLTLVLEDVMD